MAIHFSRLIPDWRLVRGVGQLQLLSRASMFMIIFVPILASLWTVVLRWLEWKDGNLPLPSSWAFLFFASLAALLGKTVFQLRCPDVVKYRGIDDYIRDKKREYTESPSLSAVTQAIDYLRELKLASELIDEEERAEKEVRERGHKLKAELENILQQIHKLDQESTAVIDRTTWENQNLDRLRILDDKANDRRRELNSLIERDRGDRGPDFRRKMALVELSAEHFYLAQARVAPVSMFLCGIAYVVAIILIIKVIVAQAQAVARAAGWV